MEELDAIVERAIDFTDRVLDAMPGYRQAAVSGLRNLRLNLAGRAPGHPALERIDEYLGSLGEDVSP